MISLYCIYLTSLSLCIIQSLGIKLQKPRLRRGLVMEAFAVCENGSNAVTCK